MKQKHELAGKCADKLNGVVEDYWENIVGKSWMFCDGNPACITFSVTN